VEQYLLSMIIFTPLFVALIMALARTSLPLLRLGALVSSGVTLLLSLVVLYLFLPDGTMQFVRKAPWIESYGISYNVGIDLLSLVLILVIGVLMPIISLYMWHEKRKGFWYNMLLLQTGVSGVVLALDVILFYLFWEMMLLPIFLMIGRYGAGERSYNVMKLLLMTVFGSMSMLLSILYMGYKFYQMSGHWSYALSDLARLQFDFEIGIWVVAGFLLAFVIKIPLVGFHTWMAPSYASAPTPAVIILSAVMAKLGVYGIWRFGFGLFGETLTHYTSVLILLCIVGLLYYTIRAVGQDGLREMFAFASGAHLSMITLGLLLANIYGWSGALYFIATHAFASAGMFLMLGLLYRRSGSFMISELGGIATQAPKFTFFFIFFALSIAGLPGTGGFVSELLIIIGAFKHSFWVGVFAAMSMVAVVLYIFTMTQQVLFGETKEATTHFDDLSHSELVLLMPLLILLIAMGVVPSFFMSLFEPQLILMLDVFKEGVA